MVVEVWLWRCWSGGLGGGVVVVVVEVVVW